VEVETEKMVRKYFGRCSSFERMMVSLDTQFSLE